MANETTVVKTTPRDFFMYLLAFIALYIAAVNFVGLLFQIVNNFFPQPVFWNWIGIIRWNIASLLVAFPVYLYTTVFLAKEIKLNPEKQQLKIRKWLTYGTLFVAAVVIMYRIARLIYSFLSGELVASFLIKTLIVLLVSSIIFCYYQRDLKQAWASLQLKALFWSTLIIVAAVLCYGIYKVRVPFVPADKIAYCQGKGLAVISDEDPIIQKTVTSFAIQNGYQVGDNCLEKWKDKKTIKFSIAWKPGSATDGSTFVCQHYPNKQVCCWPLGAEYQKTCS